jgi:uncharacterized protein YjbI with pentapeptide repeats
MTRALVAAHWVSFRFPVQVTRAAPALTSARPPRLPRLSARVARGLVALALLAGLGLATPVQADCADRAQPGVDWYRCYQDGRNLAEVDLTDARLRSTSFQRATLAGAILHEADAYNARFVSADMRGADLSEARLQDADFTRADLTNASLVNADLRGARFSHATLVGADLSGARIRETDFQNANLSGATWVRGERVCAEGSIGQCF